MTLRYHMATTTCRGLARVGRRCRIPTSVVRPLSPHGLGSRQAVAAAVAAAVPGDVGPVRTYSGRPGPFPSSPPLVSRGWAPRGATPAAAAAAALPALALGVEVTLPSAARRENNSNSSSSSSCRGSRGSRAATFSTSATNASGGEEGKGDDHANANANSDSNSNANADAGAEGAAGEKEGGSSSGGGGGGGGVKTTEEDPLEGLVPDDGDPGPPPPLDPSIVAEPSPKVLEVMEAIDSLNFVELAMLIDVFKNKLGLDEIPTLNYGGGDGDDSDGQGGAGGAEAAVEKTIFKIKVTDFGKSKVKVIKEVRTITGLGLREAKEVVETLPQVIKEDLKLDEAEELKAKLEAVGAAVELE